MTSVGGFTFGLALPENALTVDSFDYIGMIVCNKLERTVKDNGTDFFRLVLHPMAQDGPVLSREITQARVCPIT